MSNLLYLVFFGIFVGIVIVLRFTRSVIQRRHRMTILVFYILGLHALLAATRRDAWPFVSHGLFLEKSDERRPFSNVRFVAVDQVGREYQIDPNSWSPVHDRTLAVWWLVEFHRLNPEEQRQVMAFLLDKAEEWRRARRSRLRDLAAPYWYSVESAPPPSNVPYVVFRAYRVTRTPAQKLANGSESALLLAEFRR